MKSLNSYLKAPDAFFMSANNVNEVDGQLEYITGRSSIIFGTGPDDWTRWAIVHELAHRFFSESSEILQNQFFKLSLWTQDETLGDHDQRYGWRSARKDACFADSVSVPASDSYARTNPSEDFAESVAAYLINHDAFSAKCPEKADFISKKMLDGYIAPAAQKSCDQSASTKTP